MNPGLAISTALALFFWYGVFTCLESGTIYGRRRRLVGRQTEPFEFWTRWLSLLFCAVLCTIPALRMIF